VYVCVCLFPFIVRNNGRKAPPINPQELLFIIESKYVLFSVSRISIKGAQQPLLYGIFFFMLNTAEAHIQTNRIHKYTYTQSERVNVSGEHFKRIYIFIRAQNHELEEGKKIIWEKCIRTRIKKKRWR
jgi:hypothetical protein